MNPRIKQLTWLTLFSVAMGFMETVVVVYLRKIYYPDGFQFPLVPIDIDIAVAEFWREAATIVMLLGVGMLTGKTTSQRFAFFIYCFAIWDIFYYIFLKILLDWPESFLTWDILFLIPVPWVGPVIAPCIVSVTMILLAWCIDYYAERNYNVGIKVVEWILFSVGSLIIIFSFMWDYFEYAIDANVRELTSTKSVFNEIQGYIPVSYNWWLFALGQLLIIIGILKFIKRNKYAKNRFII